MRYYRKKLPNKTTIRVNKSYEGERIEEKINRIVNNKEPIKDGAPIIFTDRSDGVRPEFDIRTDRWEVAIDKLDAVSKAEIARREHRITERNKTKSDGQTIKKEVGKPEPLQGTGGDITPK